VLSASFHGRDLFAPVAARLSIAGYDAAMLRETEIRRVSDWPDDLPEIVYVDQSGNAVTGLRATMLPAAARLAVDGLLVERARTFADVPPGEPFWYENANGLAEIAVNAGRADAVLGFGVGSPVVVLP
jgi:S-adenosyl-L-methionine hydrolase (adenosine-forming)